MHTLLQENADGECDLSEEGEVPKTIQELMDVSIPETTWPRKPFIHATFCNQMRLSSLMLKIGAETG